MPAMTFSERNLTEGEQIITKFRPHWRLLFVPVGWILLGLVALWLVYAVIPWENTTFQLVMTGLILLALIPLTIAPLITWWFTTYILTTERLVTRSGMIARRGVEIPLENINNVLFHQGPIERILKSGDLLVESAGETGQSRFRSIPQPEEFQTLLYKTREARSIELAQPAAVVAPDVTAQLDRLAKLHREGVLTDAEFQEKKQKLLDQI